MSREVEHPVESKRLDSWKEIAAFFGRDERTVKRWEKSRALPVHRVPGSQRSGVFAYSRELTQWLNSTSTEKEDDAESPVSPPTFVPAIEPADHQPEPEGTTDQIFSRLPAKHWKVLATAAVLLFVVTGALLFRHLRPRISTAPSSAEANPVRAKAAADSRAVEFYLKGRYYWNRRTSDSLNHAVDSFTQAIVIDPSYAEAYAGLADTYNLMREYTSMPESEAYPRAIEAATKAVALDDSLAEAHRALAFALFYWKWEIPEAYRQYRRAIQLDPNNADAHHWYATSLLSLGHTKEALIEIERARVLSPASPSILADRALIIYSNGDHAGGIAELKEMEQAEPEFLSPPRYLSMVYFESGDYENYLNEEKRAAILSKDAQEIATADAARKGWQSSGERGMLEALAAAQEQAFDNGKSSGYRLAYTSMLLGRKKDAVRYLQAAYATHDANIFALPKSRFATELHNDPDFERLKANVRSFTDAR
jgi:tetratricopeptide (TPR) repeat protein